MKQSLVISTMLMGLMLLSTGASSETPVKPHSLRVRVVNLSTDKVKANLSVPLGFVRVGLKLGSRYAPELVDLDVTEVMAIIEQGGHGKIVDVTDEERGERVEIYAE